MNIYFSAINNAFYPEELKQSYLSSGTWPVDALLVESNVFDEFALGEIPEGKVRGAGNDGYPAWLDIPPPTHEERVVAAEQYRQQLLRQIDEVTADWRVELMLGDISDEDKTNLSEWMAYKKAVKAVDTSTAPDIAWPTPPTL